MQYRQCVAGGTAARQGLPELPNIRQMAGKRAKANNVVFSGACVERGQLTKRKIQHVKGSADPKPLADPVIPAFSLLRMWAGLVA